MHRVGVDMLQLGMTCLVSRLYQLEVKLRWSTVAYHSVQLGTTQITSHLLCRHDTSDADRATPYDLTGGAATCVLDKLHSITKAKTATW